MVVVMINIDYIMSMIDWNRSINEQMTGIRMAEDVENFNVFLQPCNKNTIKMFGKIAQKFFPKDQMKSCRRI